MHAGATLLDEHRLPTAWRGYARSEVDAVLTAVRATLSAYEARITVLETQLIESKEARDSVNRALESADRNRDAILAEAQEIGRTYRREAEQALADAAAAADRLRRAAEVDAARLTREAETGAATIAAAADRGAAEKRNRAHDEAKQLIDTATTEAERVLADARSRAEAMLADAGREAEAMRERMPRLRMVVARIEEHLRRISAEGLGHIAEVTAGIETIEAETGVTVVPLATDALPAAATVGHLIPLPDGSGLRPTERLDGARARLRVAPSPMLGELIPLPGPDEEPAADLTPLYGS